MAKVSGKGVDGYRDALAALKDGAVSRADRVAEAARERELDALLVTDLVNLRYLTGFTGSNGMAVVGPRRAPLHHRLPLRRAGGGPGPGLRPRAGAAGLRRGARRTAGRRARCGSASRTTTCPCAATRGCARCCPTGSSSCPRAASSRRCGRSRTRRRSSASPPPPSWPTRSTAMLREQGLVGRTEREVALALENEMRRRGAEPSFDVDRRLRPSAARCRTPSRPTCAIARGTLVTLDIGARLDGYCSDCTRTWATGELPDDLAEAYALVRRAQAEALAAVRPGPRGPRGRRGGARHHRGGRPRRALRPRARPRGRARGPRGAAAGAHGRRPGWSPATSSPSSPASTCRAAAACGSRTSWWSPRTATTCSPARPRTSFVVD